MSVTAISSNDNQYSMSIQAAASQRRQNTQALANALGAGDLAAAQNAFASLQGLPSSLATSQAQNGQSAGQVAAGTGNLQSLADALQSGDLSGAQAAFAALQKGHRGHHHHHHAKAAESTTTTTVSGSNAVGDATVSLLGTKLNAKA